ncbi:DEAD/DEAH box helicase [Leucobacter viscericola]|uniref:DEAD/DEAH box helicase n=1 Tax=Leucobacter viscericola TaxID=2714935 RepID=A0A6G7XEI7_9MICO|nr:DEAD/DEAH box helicase [Leucobacter viscericola]QIK62886.1 DEAD/DEAH box helicase [Leucobacter viscericola]
MAGKRRGFKAPANYEPNRGRKPKRFSGQQTDGAGKQAKQSDARRDPGRRESTRRDADPAHKGRDRDESARGNRAPATRSRAEVDGKAPTRKSVSRAEPDVVLSRIEAKLTTADDVAGMSFKDLGLGGNIVRTLEELGAVRPFPIQAATIPDTLLGRDVLGRAQTGSGKTIAFGAALVERLLILKAKGLFAGDPKASQMKPKRGERAPKRVARKPKALILAPTRELALQIDRTVQPIARSVGFYTAQMVGGVPIDPQLHALERGIDIVIGTPGRVQDLVTRRKLDLREVVVTVLDEADHMCDLGFLEPVQRILRETERGGQRLLFSATLDSGVSQLISEFLRNPAAHEAEESKRGSSTHKVLIVMREDKDQVLTQLASRRGRIMVFCRTRAYAEQVTELLELAGVHATALHGDLSQSRRERNLARFAEGKSAVLVATDVAARGIHVDDVDLVVQADPPSDYKTYLHRAGRTGRAGKTGQVVTVIPRTAQKRTREMLENAEIKPAYFGDFVPGQKL